MIVVADLAGQYSGLLALVEKFPKGEEYVMAGDLIDRGPDSNKVIQWAIDNNIRSVLGNHEHMMLDFFGRAFPDQRRKIYDRGLWDGYNGGDKTLASYGPKGVPKEHLDWLASLPLYIETDDCFISHSSVHPTMSLENACKINDWQFLDSGIIWNRDEPAPRKDGKLQIFGHNSQWGLQKFFDRTKSMEPFAICLDDSAKKKLTAYDTKTGEIYQQEYI
jgi:hypothetical protein